jgi:hypothetical protein
VTNGGETGDAQIGRERLASLELAVAERDVKLAEQAAQIGAQAAQLSEQAAQHAEQAAQIAALTEQVAKLSARPELSQLASAADQRWTWNGFTVSPLRTAPSVPTQLVSERAADESLDPATIKPVRAA